MVTNIYVFGASGDLARRKTYPALFGLFKRGILSKETKIIGYARSELKDEEFHAKLVPFVRKICRSDAETTMIPDFLAHCSYVQGGYDEDAGFQRLAKTGVFLQSSPENVQIFYLALPPTVFITVAASIRKHLYLAEGKGKNRLVVEKPFGKDLQSSNELSIGLQRLFHESEIFRIDHYLGKEMVKNVLLLRFANIFFNAVWNRNYISNVQIVFKETIGVEGRGGYFDEYGIIRDVMQNHLLQMLAVVAMERPATLDADDIRNEKVKVLQCIRPLHAEDFILGQYGPSADGKEPGYVSDETVSQVSNTPTFAMTVLNIKNERWDGVPFILRCGKGLNEQKAEIRIQFADVPGSLFNCSESFPSLARNELVLRVQPNEAVYMKMIVKKPGHGLQPMLSDLDLSYANRYVDLRIPDAYESLLWDVLRGDRANFVRADELEYAWKIFTPALHEIDGQHIAPIIYPFGSRGPESADQRLIELGFKRHQQSYSWPTQML